MDVPVFVQNILVVFSFLLLQIKLLRIILHRFLCGINFCFSVINAQGHDYWAVWKVDVRFLKKQSSSFIKSLHHFIFSLVMYQWFKFSTISPTFGIVPIFLIFAVLVGRWWYVVMVLACILLMISDAKHVFMFHKDIFTICIFTLVSYLLKCFLSYFLIVEFWEFFVYSRYECFLWEAAWQYFLLVCSLSYYPLNQVFNNDFILMNHHL